MQGAGLLEYLCYFREGKPEFYHKCRVLLDEVEATDSVCKCFTTLFHCPLSKQPYISPYLGANNVISTFLHKTVWKIQIQQPNLATLESTHLP